MKYFFNLNVLPKNSIVEFGFDVVVVVGCWIVEFGFDVVVVVCCWIGTSVVEAWKGFEVGDGGSKKSSSSSKHRTEETIAKAIARR